MDKAGKTVGENEREMRDLADRGDLKKAEEQLAKAERWRVLARGHGAPV